MRMHAEATITKVDAKDGTVTVKMMDKEGKEVEKTFQLTEDVEYIDTTGRVATLDVFQSGDQVLFIESEGKIKELKKDTKHNKTGGQARQREVIPARCSLTFQVIRHGAILARATTGIALRQMKSQCTGITSHQTQEKTMTFACRLGAVGVRHFALSNSRFG